ncbi:MAG: capsular polysaccharide transport system permease protein [Acetobacteraceae bacterium]|nr:capsular polysaccharide transport system permease protein [Acetobacteraceae bacterium]
MQISQTVPNRRVWPRATRRTFSLGRWRIALQLVAVLLPTLVTAIYYGALATDRYVSEARFVVRTASKPTSLAGGIGALMQLVGLSRSEDDAYAVRDFLLSRDAMHELAAKIDLAAVYQHHDADPLVRYPSLLFRSTDEGFYRYFGHRLSVVVNSSTGLTTLKVEAFRPEDAARVTRTLLDLGEGLVNKLNTRMQEDAVRVAAAEVAHAEQLRIDKQVAVTAFRNRELLLDPGASSAMVVELIGKLASELADTRTQIAETRSNSPSSPQLQSLRQHAAAIEQQIQTERARVSNNSDGLADKIEQYERLMLEQEFAVQTLAQSVAGLEIARVDARRQQLFLERVVEPGVPDEALMPERWRSVFTVFGFNVIGAGVLWLLIAGLSEHAGLGAR